LLRYIFLHSFSKGYLMGTAQKPSDVKLFIAFLYNENAPLDLVAEKLDLLYGKRLYSLGPLPFSWTEYYSGEMGQSLQKVYFSYEKSIDRSDLPAIKNYTNSIEELTADHNGNRTVNIDPGYVSRDKVVLATTKDFYHRLYIADGIFAEVTLHYRKGSFRYFSWTYPDFRNPATLQFLERIRAPLVKEIRTGEKL